MCLDSCVVLHPASTALCLASAKLQMYRYLHIVAAGPCSREGKEVRLQDKWARLLMAWLGWAEEEDLTSWAGRVRGGWAEQLQVLR